MKKTVTLLTALLISISSFAQGRGINYKAVIKDDLGNVLVSETINVKFTIIADTGPTDVYTETHTGVVTDVNGIIVLNIGEGTTTDIFTDITWGSDAHSLKTEIDTEQDGTFEFMNTTQFLAVPYALSAANVTGLEALDETNGIGWRLKGREIDNYGNIGLNAIDLSYNEFPSTTRGATGISAFATGFETSASGDQSTAMGYLANASGRESTALGYNTTASGVGSTAIGWQSTASSFASTSMGLYTRALGTGSLTAGNGTEANSYVETVIGQRNTIYTPNSTSEWHLADRLFVIGNGLPFGSDPRSDALIVLKNGTITAPSLDLSEITDDKALITKEYADTNLGGSGLEQITEDGNTGWRLNGQNPNNYGPIGDSAVDLSVNNFSPSTTEGATGPRSFALGSRTTAPSIVETAIGNYNIPYTPVSVNSWVGSDRLFSIGNGTTNPSNALVVLKNGTITAPSFDISEITDDKALITREYYFDKLSNGSALERLDEGNGFGWKLKFQATQLHGDIGNSSIDLTTQATGYLGGATGDYTTGIGFLSHAEGEVSTAIGWSNNSIGIGSMALGHHTTTTAYGSTAVGSYNVGGGNPDSWIITDPLFEIGNSSDINNKTNALTVLKNGTITAPSFDIFEITNNKALITKEYADASYAPNGNYLIAGGNLVTNNIGIGRLNPSSLFEVYHQDGPPTSANRTNAFSIRNVLGPSWQMYASSGNFLYLYSNGNFRGSFNGTSGAYVQTSDRRLKKDITPLESGTLNKVMQLNPVSYLMKDQTDTNRNLGLISQEVQEIFPSLTHYVEESDLLTLSYTELIPILIKALQEQQAIIETQ
ncbi:MAG: tail fiber domain-containing protein, partial [Flaviramulus sp.]|nr:tail fiber domain-containing protein [Flaviramulus sp.]